MDCLFCLIAKKVIPAEIIWENEEIVVFKDICPKAEIHLLIVPKKHIESVDALETTDTPLVGRMILIAKEMAKKLELKSKYRLVFNVGREGGQFIDHIHLHFLSGKKIELP